MASRRRVRRNRRTQRKQRGGGGFFGFLTGKTAPTPVPVATVAAPATPAAPGMNLYMSSAARKLVATVNPLHSAVANGDVDEVRRLIDDGADVNKISSGKKPLDIATNEEIKSLLREKGGTPTTISVGGRRCSRHTRRSCRRCR